MPREVPDWWDDVPIEAYENEGGEAEPLPEAPGETRAPVYCDPLPEPEPAPEPAPEKPAPRRAGGFGTYLDLREQGFNSEYAAEQAVRHIREEQRQAEEER